MTARYAPDTESARPTKEALRRAHPTRHMVRNMSLSLPGEEAILICVRSWVYVLWRWCTDATWQVATAYDRLKDRGQDRCGICGERNEMARVAADPDAARRRWTSYGRRRATRSDAKILPSYLSCPRRLPCVDCRCNPSERFNRDVTPRPSVGWVQRSMQQGS